MMDAKFDQRAPGWTGLLVLMGFLALGPARAASAGGDVGGDCDASPFARSLRGEAPRPRLVVVISVDQFRADYLTRYADLFAPAECRGRVGGFKYLMTRGAWFVDARYQHYPLSTGPGHATILTGAHPYQHGIVGNDWWDPANRKLVYCVDDPRWKVVGAAASSTARPMGPLNLRSSTVGDELKLATAGRGKVVGVSLKDRAAVLLGGHAADAAVWYDEDGGRWISSTAYCRDGKLPAWAEQVNGERVPDRSLGSTWQPQVAQEVLAARTFVPTVVGEGPYRMGRTFPHAVGSSPDRQNYAAFTLTPAANDYVLHTAERAVEAEQLGGDCTPDVLAINLATVDYAGHAWGPYSPELLDLVVRTDGALADFFNFLDGRVEGGLKSVVIVLTADHGVAPVPEDAASLAFGLSAGRVSPAAVVKQVRQALTERFGEPVGGTWFSEVPGADSTEAKLALKRSGAFVDGSVYLSDEAVRGAIAGGKARDRREVEAAACEALSRGAVEGVYACYGKSQVLAGALAGNGLAEHLARGVHPRLSGDLIVIPEPMHVSAAATATAATGHGTPYAYDCHVPVMLCGPGVRAGVYAEPVSPADVAPTLSLLLGIEYPSACEGRPLARALK
jgi:predicted AlkP superfamily pyrophosphatase or phosphodiesterase